MKRCLCPLLPLIWFFAAVPLRAGADEPALSARKEAPPKYPVTELAVPDSVFKDTERHWMGVYFNGVKCGWAGRSIGPDTLDGKKCITAGETMVMEMKVFKQIIRTISITRTCYSTEAPYRALLIETTEKRGEQERHVQFRNAG
ncbi:MAG TPA: hypothetical protein VHM91_08890, partial [Verrucomicrobiales bacterium]|nr:hypothetical protein [Verrucomicrobiales bacterium]